MRVCPGAGCMYFPLCQAAFPLTACPPAVTCFLQVNIFYVPPCSKRTGPPILISFLLSWFVGTSCHH